MQLSRWIVALLLGGIANAAAPKPLECPDGTTLERSAGVRGDRLEICKDAKSGAQHGPARLYDHSDKLIMEMVHDSGRETSRQYTPAGVARYIKDVNDSKKASKMPWYYVIVNAQTLRYVIAVDRQPDEPIDEKKVHVDLAGTEPCLLMLLPGAAFQTLEMRVQRPGGKVWFHTDITREECVRH
jgi:hypothetical protein